ncbi:hypothetical protein PILCRDRAFT_830424 [Piloderma croceum F 1598]|uniref:Uncharacterized protein n=1 Tax=Piloderma croceum (strain F 1598) TaxID=765440 RepID=A0A0C3EF75_PILCF|nr:hypothetical protein PILCRDRAFT_830424 [Piloderma croceum F 1598]
MNTQLFCQGCQMQRACQRDTNRPIPYGLPEAITIDHMSSVQGPYAIIYRIPHDTYTVRLNRDNEVDLSLLPWYHLAREYLTISLKKDTPETLSISWSILTAERIYDFITPDGRVQIIHANEYLAYQRKVESIERTKQLEEQPKPLGWRKRLSNLFLWMTRAGKDKTPPQVDVVGNPSTPSSQHSFDEPRTPSMPYSTHSSVQTLVDI